MNNQVSQYFADKPFAKYLCPTCKRGSLVPDLKSFSVIEPQYSKEAHGQDEWDPHWVEYRFTFVCVCDRKSCGEVAFVSGQGGVEQRYDHNHEPEYYDSFRIRSFFPAPPLIKIPEDAPDGVKSQLARSFSIYWVDVSSAANALRASLEDLLTELGIPDTQVNKTGDTVRINLHTRIDNWSKTQKDNAELCLALKEVGNLGSHGEIVREKHYFGVLAIYEHVLSQLFENNAAKMKALATQIQAEIKGLK